MKKWTNEKDKQLRSLMENNESWEEIARQLNTTVSAIKSRAAKYKLKHASTYGKLTQEQLEYIKNEYPNKTIHTLKTELNSSWETVRNALESMGIETKKDKAWTDSDIELLRQLAENTELDEIAKKMNKTTNSIYLKARKLGIVLAMSPRKWTKEEIDILKENWGTVSLTTIAKNIRRDKQAVLQQAHKLKLGSIYNSTEYVTVSEFQEFTGITRDRIRTTLMVKYDFPLKQKKLINNKMQLINLDEAIEWMEIHQDLFDGSKVKEGTFIPEPEWLKTKRRNDYKSKEEVNYQIKKRPWTSEEISYAISLLNIGISHDEIAVRLNRSKQAVQARLNKEGKAYKLKRFWTGKEFKFIQDNYKSMTDKEMAIKLNRPVKSVEYQRLNLGIRRK